MRAVVRFAKLSGLSCAYALGPEGLPRGAARRPRRAGRHVHDLRASEGETFGGAREGALPIDGVIACGLLERDRAHARWRLGCVDSRRVATPEHVGDVVCAANGDATHAVKYGADDAPLTIRVLRVGRTARISVHDEVTPIPPEAQEHLLARFARADSAGSSANGWGLGLTVVSSCADAHAGRATVVSDDGIGTTFTIESTRGPSNRRVSREV